MNRMSLKVKPDNAAAAADLIWLRTSKKENGKTWNGLKIGSWN